MALRECFLLIALILLDQFSKILAVKFLEPIGSYPLVSWLSFTYIENKGISFGMLQDWNNGVLLILNSCLAAAILWYYQKQKYCLCSSIVCDGLLLISAGALGNIADRLMRGYVVDFIDFHFWPVFNLADSMITIGAAVYLIGSFKNATNN